MFVHRVPSCGRLRALAGRHQAALACAIAIALLLSLHHSFGFTGNHFDSAYYWWLASPGNFGSGPSLRGYAFPALLAPLNYLCSISDNPVQTYRTGMAIVYGVLLTTLLPAAFQQAFGGQLSLVRRLVPVVLLAGLFPGLLLFPLSDLPAALLALAALMCTLRGLDPAASRSRFVGLLAAAGALIGAAYNTRTIYLFAVILLGLLAVVTIRGAWVRPPFSRWLGLAAFAAGVVAVSLPQLAINNRTLGVNSLAVQSMIGSRSLFAAQLVWGMRLQRYETTLNAEASSPQVFYFDPAGTQLFKDAARGGDLSSLPYYLKAVAQHPLQFLALYTRHVVNGLDVRDGLIYTLKPSALRSRTALFNFLVLALATLVVATIRRRPVRPGGGARAVPRSWPVSLALLLLPVAAIVPGAIETRFFLPLHLLAYCALAFHFDTGALRACVKRHWVLIALVLLVVGALFFAISSSTMAQVKSAWPDQFQFDAR
jgi:hypothetical protein